MNPDNADYKNRAVHYLFKNKDFDLVMNFEEHFLNSKSMTINTRLLYSNTLATIGRIKDARSDFVYLLSEYKESRFMILAELALLHSVYEFNLVKARFINQYILNN